MGGGNRGLDDGHVSESQSLGIKGCSRGEIQIRTGSIDPFGLEVQLYHGELVRDGSSPERNFSLAPPLVEEAFRSFPASEQRGRPGKFLYKSVKTFEIGKS